MRLIDADIKIKELNDKIARLDARQQIYMENGLIAMADTMARKIELYIECREILEHQPTSYDVDKVLEQLKNEKEFWNDATYNKEIGKQKARSYEHAIEIVKGGGLDGNTNT